MPALPAYRGSRHAAFQVAKIGNWLARSSQGSVMKWLSYFRCSVLGTRINDAVRYAHRILPELFCW
ncbi:MAG: hypothetical protein [Olavius algarvensis Gamma 1 endosymbiont]|nr:MAG: hypothetical protein [Olavius algarvensis Gamma 1 endosymbiont]